MAVALSTDSTAEEVVAFDLDEATSDLDGKAPPRDSVKAYLKEIKTPLLTADEEVALAKSIEAGLYAEHKLRTESNLTKRCRADLEQIAEDGRQAKNHMLEANLRLVVSVAKRYKEQPDKGLAFLDFIQWGNEGLIRAVEKFDYTKGYKFSTYAMWWIRKSIGRGIADMAGTIRLPVHVWELINKLYRVRREMEQDLGRAPTTEELAKELGISEARIKQTDRDAQSMLSLDVENEEGMRFGDGIEDEDGFDATEFVTSSCVLEALRTMLDALGDREKRIMELRFGFGTDSPMTQTEVARAIGVSRTYVNQTEMRCLQILRQPDRKQALMELLAS